MEFWAAVLCELDDDTCGCRQYNELVESVAEEVEEMARTQKRCVAEQMKLDEQSLQRLKAQEAKQKVLLDVLCLFHGLVCSFLPAACPEAVQAVYMSERVRVHAFLARCILCSLSWRDNSIHFCVKSCTQKRQRG